jgi:catechol 2,3-dioxygenase-like lactoylglutathione lyase family enzyme
MRGFLLLVVGLSAGFGIGQSRPVDHEIVSLNHVAIAVEDFDAEAAFYSEVLGFPEAFVFRDEGGAPVFGYFQINGSTFVELMPVQPDRPAGLVHFGLEARDAASVVEHLRRADARAEDPALSSFTGSMVANAVSPSGTSFEVLEFGPESLTRKAMESWR